MTQQIQTPRGGGWCSLGYAARLSGLAALKKQHPLLLTQVGWVSRGGSFGGGQRAATPGCEGASLCGVVWGVVGLLMGGGVQTAEERPEASCYLMKKSPSAL